MNETNVQQPYKNTFLSPERWCLVFRSVNSTVNNLTLVVVAVQEQQRKGVIVSTDCNFSMAVAHHAVELKIPVFAIMPSSCSSPRLRVYRDYGAMVISYGSTGHDSRNHARHLASENGYLYLEESVPRVSRHRVNPSIGFQICDQLFLAVCVEQR